MQNPFPEEHSAYHQSRSVERHDQDQEETIDLSTLWNGILRRLPWILGTSLALSAAGYFYFKSLPKVYQSSSSLATTGNMSIGNLKDSMVTSSPLPEGVLQEALQGPVVLGEIINNIKAVNLPPEIANELAADLQEELQTRKLTTISLTPRINVVGSGMYTVSAKAPTAESAAKLTNVTVNALLNWDKSRASRGVQAAKVKLENQLAALRQQLSQSNLTEDQRKVLTESQRDIESKIAQTVVQIEGATGFLEPVAPAVVPLDPIAPRPLRNAVLLFFLTGLIGMGIAALRTVLDKTVRTEEDLLSFELPVLGSLPRVPKRQLKAKGIVEAAKDGPLYESLGFLKVNILSLLGSKKRGVVMISSIAPTEGKSSLTATIADNLASEGRRVLIVDADLRRGTQQDIWAHALQQPKWVSISGDAAEGAARSLRELLERPTQNVQAIEIHEHLHLLRAGPGVQNSLALLSSVSMQDYFWAWQKKYDIILVDSPPVLALADAIALGKHVDHMILVVESDTTHLGGIRQSLRRLSNAGLEVDGFVINKVEPKKDTNYNYNYSYSVTNKY